PAARWSATRMELGRELQLHHVRHRCAALCASSQRVAAPAENLQRHPQSRNPRLTPFFQLTVRKLHPCLFHILMNSASTGSLFRVAELVAQQVHLRFLGAEPMSLCTNAQLSSRRSALASRSVRTAGECWNPGVCSPKLSRPATSQKTCSSATPSTATPAQPCVPMRHS